MSDDSGTSEATVGDAEAPEPAVPGLVERVRAIEGEPLDRRAVAFGELHDELRAVLESTPPASRDGR